MHTTSRIFLLLLLISISEKLLAQSATNFPPPENPPEIRAMRATEKINLDGRLDEADWQRAQTTSDFFRTEPRQGGAYKYKTYVKILFDEKNLYVGFFAEDSLGRKGIRAQDLRRDFRWGENDIVSIQLDAQNTKQYCVSFQTTPYGNQRDLQNFNDSNFDNNWNALWSVRTTRTDSGYYAEFAIPFKSIRYERPQNDGPVEWGFTLSRLARRDYEQTVFPDIPQAFSIYRMTYAAKLTGLEVPKPSANVRIEPYALLQYDRDKAYPTDITAYQPKIGGDAKWAINPKSVLDITVNTDFAQADVDRAVNNLGRFNIFFPERRQFFLENSGIWAGAGGGSLVPFFTRRIGLQGTFNAQPARIDVGSRYTQRDEKQTIAGLYIRQAATEQSAIANFGVFRYLRNYGKQNNAGVMVTHRFDEANQELGLDQAHNTTVTTDGFIRPKDEWTVSYLASASKDNGNDTIGLAGRAAIRYNPNNLYAGWSITMIGKHYNPEMGFVNQNNVIHHSPGAYYIWRPKKIPWIRRWDPGAFFDYYHDAQNPRNFQQASFYIFPVYLFFADGSFLEYSIFPTWQNINFNFAPLGIPIEQGNYYYTRQKIFAYTDRSAKVSASGSINWGGFYNGTQTAISGGLRIAPTVYAALTLDYEFNGLRNIGALEQDLDIHLATIGARFALNPRLQLSAFYQYNSFDQQGRWNIRTSWEYRPLSFVYLVFNHANTEILPEPTQQQQLIAKITFVNQF